MAEEFTTPMLSKAPKRQNSRVFGDLSNEGNALINICIKPTHPGDPRINPLGWDTKIPQGGQHSKPDCLIQPPSKDNRSSKPSHLSNTSKSDRSKSHSFGLLQRRKKRKHGTPTGRSPHATSPEDCISHLPTGIPFPKKPPGCEVVPQTIEPRRNDRSSVYFTRNGVLGMPLQYMNNLEDMDDGDEPVNLGLDPSKSCHITLVIAWPGYKEATYEIIAFTPLYPTAPFVTVYGLRRLTKRELAIETLRCVHQWMIERPWSGERYGGIPEWKLSGEKSPGVSAKLVWLAMISPIGDGRWVTQLQKAPGS